MDTNDEEESEATSSSGFEDREREELNRKKNAKIDQAKKKCPIRTRFKPQFEEETKQAQAAFVARLKQPADDKVARMPSRISRASKATKFTTVSNLSQKNGQPALDDKLNMTDRKKLMDNYSMLRMMETSKSWNPELYGKQKKKKKLTDSERNSKMYRASQVLKKAASAGKREIIVAKETGKKFAETAMKESFSASGADRVAYGAIEAMHLGYADDLDKYGVTERERRQVQRLKSFDDLKASCGLERRNSAYHTFVEHGRFHSCAKAASADNEEIQEQRAFQKEIQDALDESHDPHNHGLGMTKKDALAIMRNLDEEQIQQEEAEAAAANAFFHDPDKARHFTGRMHKNPVNVEDVEDLWWANCHGQASIRRKPMEHEAVYDFADCRISMPRELTGGARAGQILTVKAHINKDGTKGEVLVHTKAPKRACTDQPAKLDYFIERGETQIREMFDSSLTERVVGLNKHGHLATSGVPPTTQHWLEWRDIQKKKQAAAREAAMAVEMAERALQASKGKPSAAADEDDFRSQASSHEGNSGHEGHDVMSAPPTARNPAGAIADGVVHDPHAGKARMGRRMALDSHQDVDENTPWHSRPLPSREDLRRVMMRLGMADPAGAGVGSPRATSRPSPRSGASPRASASPRIRASTWRPPASPRGAASPRLETKRRTEIKPQKGSPVGSAEDSFDPEDETNPGIDDEDERPPLYSRVFALSTLGGKPLELVISVDVHHESDDEDSEHEEDDGFWQDHHLNNRECSQVSSPL